MGRANSAWIYEMKSVPTKVVYTAVFGDYDYVQCVDPNWDCDFICFTDNPQIVSPGWRVVMAKLDGVSPAEMSRRFKMLPHKYLANYECSLYVDGNIKLLTDPIPLFEKYLGMGAIAIPKHQDRDCAYAEARLCIKAKRVNREIVIQQMSRYAEEGFPEKFGMTENGVLFRRHHDKNVVALMEAWWLEYCSGGKRDQLSLPYLIWRHKIGVAEVIEGPRRSNKHFEIGFHVTDKSRSFISRMARKVNGKKHLRFDYFIISKIISFAVEVRDKLSDRRVHKK